MLARGLPLQLKPPLRSNKAVPRASPVAGIAPATTLLWFGLVVAGVIAFFKLPPVTLAISGITLQLRTSVHSSGFKHRRP
jgi:hypothetical protein